MRTVLVGAIEGSLTVLHKMAAIGRLPVAVVALPPSRASRHSDYADLSGPAREYGCRVIPAIDVNDAAVITELRDVAPDYIFVLGWSQICRAPFLSTAQGGVVGSHPSLLPRNRGRAVIPWTILQRLTETGVSLFWLDEGTDSGDIFLQRKFPVAADETAASLYQKHVSNLCDALEEGLGLLARGDPPRTRQDQTGATYCAKRVVEDGYIDWSRSAEDIWTLIRATSKPYPGAFTFYGGRRVIVWAADLVGDAPYWGLPGQVQRKSEAGALVQCGDRQHLLLTRIQMEGEAETAGSFLKLHDKLGPSLLPWQAAR